MKLSLIITSKTGRYEYPLPRFHEVIFATGSTSLINDKNEAARKSTGDVLVFLDDDAYIWHPCQFLESLYKEMGDCGFHGFACLTTARIIGHDTPFDEMCSQDFGTDWRFFTKNDVTNRLHIAYNIAKAVFRKLTHPMKQLRQYAPPPWGIGNGTCFAIKRSVFFQVCGFSEMREASDGVAGCEDIDLFYRVLKAGGVITYQPEMLVKHEHNRLTKQQALERKREYWRGNKRLIRQLFN